MNQRIKLSVELHKFNEYLTLKALGELDSEHLYERPLDRCNSFYWVIGHIVWTRYELAKALGLEETLPGGDLFEIGAEIRDPEVYPPFEELTAAYTDICAKLNTKFEVLTDAELDGTPPFKIPGIEESIAGIVSFLSFHESYHVGQLAYILRIHGGKQLVG